MPNSGLTGFNKVYSASGDNRVGSTVKTGGTSLQYRGIPIQRDSNFTGNDFNDLNQMESLGSTPVGDSIQKIISGSGIGGAGDVRSLIEVHVSDRIPTKGGLNSKSTGEYHNITGGLAAGGAWSERIDGRWQNSSGVISTPVGSSVTIKNIIAGSGDREAPTRYRQTPQQYHYRQYGTNNTKNLALRTQ